MKIENPSKGLRATVNPSNKYRGYNLTTFSFHQISKKWNVIERGLYRNEDTALKDANDWLEKTEYIQNKDKDR